MNDPDVPRMTPDLPQFSGITPTDALATAVGADGPADLFHSGDTIVAVGTRDGLDHLVRIIAGSG